MVESDIEALKEAGRRFFEEYGFWPSDKRGTYADQRFGLRPPNRQVLNILRAVDGPGNPDHVTNPHRIVFIEVEPSGPGLSGLDRHGDFVDPWGAPYELVLDTDLNNVCDIDDSRYQQVLAAGMAVWSCGPDGDSDNRDDIRSWEPETSSFLP
jgi:hypothetical protein